MPGDNILLCLTEITRRRLIDLVTCRIIKPIVVTVSKDLPLSSCHITRRGIPPPATCLHGVSCPVSEKLM